MAAFQVVITYSNGSTDTRPFPNYLDARTFCRDGISYSGGRIRRVEVHTPDGSVFAVWDAAWDAVSQHAGLHD